MVTVIEYITIENEDALRQNITNSNLANNSVRTEIIKVALANTDTQLDVDDYRAWQTKVDELKKWEVPILEPNAPNVAFHQQHSKVEFSEPIGATILKDFSAE